MFSIVFFSLGFIYLYGSHLVLHRIQKDYADFGMLRNSTAVLQLLIFATHALFLLLSFKTPHWPFSWPALTPYPWAWIIGLLLLAGGGTILFRAFRIFDSTDRVLGRQVTVLKKEGIYQWSRNPQVVGYGMILLALPFLWYTDYTLIAVILYAPIAHRLVLVEEEHLSRIFKEKYEAYCEETARYLGRKPLASKVRAEKYSMGNP